MLGVIAAAKGGECFVITECWLVSRAPEGFLAIRTCVHRPEHARNEFVDAIALLYQWHQSGNAALVVRATAEVREDELLERVYLVLQGHEVGNGLVALVGVVDGLQADVLLILECSWAYVSAMQLPLAC